MSDVLSKSFRRPTDINSSRPMQFCAKIPEATVASGAPRGRPRLSLKQNITVSRGMKRVGYRCDQLIVYVMLRL